jgi:hypothetical protein
VDEATTPAPLPANESDDQGHYTGSSVIPGDRPEFPLPTLHSEHTFLTAPDNIDRPKTPPDLSFEDMRALLTRLTGLQPWQLEAFPDEYPPLPISRPSSPFGTPEPARPSIQIIERRLSSTAVPIRFRKPAGPLVVQRDIVAEPEPKSTLPAETSPLRPRHVKAPSAEFKASREIRPLYLLERIRKPDDIDEGLPALPSSGSPSRASSVTETDVEYESALESPNLSASIVSDDPFFESFDAVSRVISPQPGPELQHSELVNREVEELERSGQVTPKASDFHAGDPQEVAGPPHNVLTAALEELEARDRHVTEDELPASAPGPSQIRSVNDLAPIAPLDDSGMSNFSTARSLDDSPIKSFSTLQAPALGSSMGSLDTAARDSFPIPAGNVSDDFKAGDVHPETIGDAAHSVPEPIAEPVQPTLTRASLSTSKKGRKGKKGSKDKKIGENNLVSGMPTPVDEETEPVSASTSQPYIPTFVEDEDEWVKATSASIVTDDATLVDEPSGPLVLKGFQREKVLESTTPRAPENTEVRRATFDDEVKDQSYSSAQFHSMEGSQQLGKESLWRPTKPRVEDRPAESIDSVVSADVLDMTLADMKATSHRGDPLGEKISTVSPVADKIKKNKKGKRGSQQLNLELSNPLTGRFQENTALPAPETLQATLEREVLEPVFADAGKDSANVLSFLVKDSEPSAVYSEVAHEKVELPVTESQPALVDREVALPSTVIADGGKSDDIMSYLGKDIESPLPAAGEQLREHLPSDAIVAIVEQPKETYPVLVTDKPGTTTLDPTPSIEEVAELPKSLVNEHASTPEPESAQSGWGTSLWGALGWGKKKAPSPAPTPKPSISTAAPVIEEDRDLPLPPPPVATLNSDKADVKPNVEELLEDEPVNVEAEILHEHMQQEPTPQAQLGLDSNDDTSQIYTDANISSEAPAEDVEITSFTFVPQNPFFTDNGKPFFTFPTMTGTSTEEILPKPLMHTPTKNTSEEATLETHSEVLSESADAVRGVIAINESTPSESIPAPMPLQLLGLVGDDGSSQPSSSRIKGKKNKKKQTSIAVAEQVDAKPTVKNQDLINVSQIPVERQLEHLLERPSEKRPAVEQPSMQIHTAGPGDLSEEHIIHNLQIELAPEDIALPEDISESNEIERVFPTADYIVSDPPREASAGDFELPEVMSAVEEPKTIETTATTRGNIVEEDTTPSLSKKKSKKAKKAKSGSKIANTSDLSESSTPDIGRSLDLSAAEQSATTIGVGVDVPLPEESSQEREELMEPVTTLEEDTATLTRFDEDVVFEPLNVPLPEATSEEFDDLVEPTATSMQVTKDSAVEPLITPDRDTVDSAPTAQEAPIEAIPTFRDISEATPSFTESVLADTPKKKTKKGKKGKAQGEIQTPEPQAETSMDLSGTSLDVLDRPEGFELLPQNTELEIAGTSSLRATPSEPITPLETITSLLEVDQPLEAVWSPAVRGEITEKHPTPAEEPVEADLSVPAALKKNKKKNKGKKAKEIEVALEDVPRQEKLIETAPVVDDVTRSANVKPVQEEPDRFLSTVDDAKPENIQLPDADEDEQLHLSIDLAPKEPQPEASLIRQSVKEDFVSPLEEHQDLQRGQSIVTEPPTGDSIRTDEVPIPIAPAQVDLQRNENVLVAELPQPVTIQSPGTATADDFATASSVKKGKKKKKGKTAQTAELSEPSTPNIEVSRELELHEELIRPDLVAGSVSPVTEQIHSESPHPELSIDIDSSIQDLSPQTVVPVEAGVDDEAPTQGGVMELSSQPSTVMMEEIRVSSKKAKKKKGKRGNVVDESEPSTPITELQQELGDVTEPTESASSVDPAVPSQEPLVEELQYIVPLPEVGALVQDEPETARTFIDSSVTIDPQAENIAEPSQTSIPTGDKASTSSKKSKKKKSKNGKAADLEPPAATTYEAVHEPETPIGPALTEPAFNTALAPSFQEPQDVSLPPETAGELDAEVVKDTERTKEVAVSALDESAFDSAFARRLEEAVNVPLPQDTHEEAKLSQESNIPDVPVVSVLDEPTHQNDDAIVEENLPTTSKKNRKKEGKKDRPLDSEADAVELSKMNLMPESSHEPTIMEPVRDETPDMASIASQDTLLPLEAAGVPLPEAMQDELSIESEAVPVLDTASREVTEAIIEVEPATMLKKSKKKKGKRNTTLESVPSTPVAENLAMLPEGSTEPTHIEKSVDNELQSTKDETTIDSQVPSTALPSTMESPPVESTSTMLSTSTLNQTAEDITTSTVVEIKADDNSIVPTLKKSKKKKGKKGKPEDITEPSTPLVEAPAFLVEPVAEPTSSQKVAERTDAVQEQSNLEVGADGTFPLEAAPITNFEESPTLLTKDESSQDATIPQIVSEHIIDETEPSLKNALEKGEDKKVNSSNDLIRETTPESSEPGLPLESLPNLKPIDEEIPLAGTLPVETSPEIPQVEEYPLPGSSMELLVERELAAESGQLSEPVSFEVPLEAALTDDPLSTEKPQHVEPETPRLDEPVKVEETIAISKKSKKKKGKKDKSISEPRTPIAEAESFITESNTVDVEGAPIVRSESVGKDDIVPVDPENLIQPDKDKSVEPAAAEVVEPASSSSQLSLDTEILPIITEAITEQTDDVTPAMSLPRKDKKKTKKAAQKSIAESATPEVFSTPIDEFSRELELPTSNLPTVSESQEIAAGVPLPDESNDFLPTFEEPVHATVPLVVTEAVPEPIEEPIENVTVSKKDKKKAKRGKRASVVEEALSVPATPLEELPRELGQPPPELQAELERQEDAAAVPLPDDQTVSEPVSPRTTPTDHSVPDLALPATTLNDLEVVQSSVINDPEHHIDDQQTSTLMNKELIVVPTQTPDTEDEPATSKKSKKKVKKGKRTSIAESQPSTPFETPAEELQTSPFDVQPLSIQDLLSESKEEAISTAIDSQPSPIPEAQEISQESLKILPQVEQVTSLATEEPQNVEQVTENEPATVPKKDKKKGKKLKRVLIAESPSVPATPIEEHRELELPVEEQAVIAPAIVEEPSPESLQFEEPAIVPTIDEPSNEVTQGNEPTTKSKNDKKKAKKYKRGSIAESATFVPADTPTEEMATNPLDDLSVSTLPVVEEVTSEVATVEADHATSVVDKSSKGVQDEVSVHSEQAVAAHSDLEPEARDLAAIPPVEDSTPTLTLGQEPASQEPQDHGSISTSKRGKKAKKSAKQESIAGAEAPELTIPVEQPTGDKSETTTFASPQTTASTVEQPAVDSSIDHQTSTSLTAPEPLVSSIAEEAPLSTLTIVQEADQPQATAIDIEEPVIVAPVGEQPAFTIEPTSTGEKLEDQAQEESTSSSKTNKKKKGKKSKSASIVDEVFPPLPVAVDDELAPPAAYEEVVLSPVAEELKHEQPTVASIIETPAAPSDDLPSATALSLPDEPLSVDTVALEETKDEEAEPAEWASLSKSQKKKLKKAKRGSIAPVETSQPATPAEELPRELALVEESSRIPVVEPVSEQHPVVQDTAVDLAATAGHTVAEEFAFVDKPAVVQESTVVGAPTIVLDPINAEQSDTVEQFTTVAEPTILEELAVIEQPTLSGKSIDVQELPTVENPTTELSPADIDETDTVASKKGKKKLKKAKRASVMQSEVSQPATPVEELAKELSFEGPSSTDEKQAPKDEPVPTQAVDELPTVERPAGDAGERAIPSKDKKKKAKKQQKTETETVPLKAQETSEPANVFDTQPSPSPSIPSETPLLFSGIPTSYPQSIRDIEFVDHGGESGRDESGGVTMVEAEEGREMAATKRHEVQQYPELAQPTAQIEVQVDVPESGGVETLETGKGNERENQPRRIVEETVPETVEVVVGHADLAEALVGTDEQHTSNDEARVAEPQDILKDQPLSLDESHGNAPLESALSEESKPIMTGFDTTATAKSNAADNDKAEASASPQKNKKRGGNIGKLAAMFERGTPAETPTTGKERSARFKTGPKASTSEVMREIPDTKLPESIATLPSRQIQVTKEPSEDSETTSLPQSITIETALSEPQAIDTDEVVPSPVSRSESVLVETPVSVSAKVNQPAEATIEDSSSLPAKKDKKKGKKSKKQSGTATPVELTRDVQSAALEEPHQPQSEEAVAKIAPVVHSDIPSDILGVVSEQPVIEASAKDEPLSVPTSAAELANAQMANEIASASQAVVQDDSGIATSSKVEKRGKKGKQQSGTATPVEEIVSKPLQRSLDETIPAQPEQGANESYIDVALVPEQAEASLQDAIDPFTAETVVDIPREDSPTAATTAIVPLEQVENVQPLIETITLSAEPADEELGSTPVTKDKKKGKKAKKSRIDVSSVDIAPGTGAQEQSISMFDAEAKAQPEPETTAERPVDAALLGAFESEPQLTAPASEQAIRPPNTTAANMGTLNVTSPQVTGTPVDPTPVDPEDIVEETFTSLSKNDKKKAKKGKRSGMVTPASEAPAVVQPEEELLSTKAVDELSDAVDHDKVIDATVIDITEAEPLLVSSLRDAPNEEHVTKEVNSERSIEHTIVDLAEVSPLPVPKEDQNVPLAEEVLPASSTQEHMASEPATLPSKDVPEVYSEHRPADSVLDPIARNTKAEEAPASILQEKSVVEEQHENEQEDQPALATAHPEPSVLERAQSASSKRKNKKKGKRSGIATPVNEELAEYKLETQEPGLITTVENEPVPEHPLSAVTQDYLASVSKDKSQAEQSLQASVNVDQTEHVAPVSDLPVLPLIWTTESEISAPVSKVQSEPALHEGAMPSISEKQSEGKEKNSEVSAPLNVEGSEPRVGNTQGLEVLTSDDVNDTSVAIESVVVQERRDIEEPDVSIAPAVEAAESTLDDWTAPTISTKKSKKKVKNLGAATPVTGEKPSSQPDDLTIPTDATASTELGAPTPIESGAEELAKNEEVHTTRPVHSASVEQATEVNSLPRQSIEPEGHATQDQPAIKTPTLPLSKKKGKKGKKSIPPTPTIELDNPIGPEARTIEAADESTLAIVPEPSKQTIDEPLFEESPPTVEINENADVPKPTLTRDLNKAEMQTHENVAPEATLEPVVQNAPSFEQQVEQTPSTFERSQIVEVHQPLLLDEPQPRSPTVADVDVLRGTTEQLVSLDDAPLAKPTAENIQEVAPDDERAAPPKKGKKAKKDKKSRKQPASLDRSDDSEGKLSQTVEQTQEMSLLQPDAAGSEPLAAIEPGREPSELGGVATETEDVPGILRHESLQSEDGFPPPITDVRDVTEQPVHDAVTAEVQESTVLPQGIQTIYTEVPEPRRENGVQTSSSREIAKEGKEEDFTKGTVIEPSKIEKEILVPSFVESTERELLVSSTPTIEQHYGPNAINLSERDSSIEQASDVSLAFEPEFGFSTQPTLIQQAEETLITPPLVETIAETHVADDAEPNELDNKWASASFEKPKKKKGKRTKSVSDNTADAEKVVESAITAEAIAAGRAESTPYQETSANDQLQEPYIGVVEPASNAQQTLESTFTPNVEPMVEISSEAQGTSREPKQSQPETDDLDPALSRSVSKKNKKKKIKKGQKNFEDINSEPSAPATPINETPPVLIEPPTEAPVILPTIEEARVEAAPSSLPAPFEVVRESDGSLATFAPAVHGQAKVQSDSDVMEPVLEAAFEGPHQEIATWTVEHTPVELSSNLKAIQDEAADMKLRAEALDQALIADEMLHEQSSSQPTSLFEVASKVGKKDKKKSKKSKGNALNSEPTTPAVQYDTAVETRDIIEEPIAVEEAHIITSSSPNLNEKDEKEAEQGSMSLEAPLLEDPATETSGPVVEQPAYQSNVVDDSMKHEPNAAIVTVEEVVPTPLQEPVPSSKQPQVLIEERPLLSRKLSKKEQKKAKQAALLEDAPVLEAQIAGPEASIDSQVSNPDYESTLPKSDQVFPEPITTIAVSENQTIVAAEDERPSLSRKLSKKYKNGAKQPTPTWNEPLESADETIPLPAILPSIETEISQENVVIEGPSLLNSCTSHMSSKMETGFELPQAGTSRDMAVSDVFGPTNVSSVSNEVNMLPATVIDKIRPTPAAAITEPEITTFESEHSNMTRVPPKIDDQDVIMAKTEAEKTVELSAVVRKQGEEKTQNDKRETITHNLVSPKASEDIEVEMIEVSQMTDIPIELRLRSSDNEPIKPTAQHELLKDAPPIVSEYLQQSRYLGAHDQQLDMISEPNRESVSVNTLVYEPEVALTASSKKSKKDKHKSKKAFDTDGPDFTTPIETTYLEDEMAQLPTKEPSIVLPAGQIAAHDPEDTRLRVTPSLSAGASTFADTSDANQPPVLTRKTSKTHQLTALFEGAASEGDRLSESGLRRETTGSVKNLAEQYESQSRSITPVLPQPSKERFISQNNSDYQPHSQSPGRDIDFAATVAAGLKESGFNDSYVVSDPAFSRSNSAMGVRDIALNDEISAAKESASVSKFATRGWTTPSSSPKLRPITELQTEVLPPIEVAIASTDAASFDPLDVLNDPTFSRRKTPPGTLEEGDPDELGSTSKSKKKPKGKKKRTPLPEPPVEISLPELVPSVLDEKPMKGPSVNHEQTPVRPLLYEDPTTSPSDLLHTLSSEKSEPTQLEEVQQEASATTTSKKGRQSKKNNDRANITRGSVENAIAETPVVEAHINEPPAVETPIDSTIREVKLEEPSLSALHAVVPSSVVYEPRELHTNDTIDNVWDGVLKEKRGLDDVEPKERDIGTVEASASVQQSIHSSINSARESRPDDLGKSPVPQVIPIQQELSSRRVVEEEITPIHQEQERVDDWANPSKKRSKKSRKGKERVDTVVDTERREDLAAVVHKRRSHPVLVHEDQPEEKRLHRGQGTLETGMVLDIITPPAVQTTTEIAVSKVPRVRESDVLPTEQEATATNEPTWSFASVRDSAMHMADSPTQTVVPHYQESVRDSGNHNSGGSPVSQQGVHDQSAAPSHEKKRRSKEPHTPRGDFVRGHKGVDSTEESPAFPENTALAGVISPDYATKERTSYLFDSSPSTRAYGTSPVVEPYTPAQDSHRHGHIHSSSKETDDIVQSTTRLQSVSHKEPSPLAKEIEQTESHQSIFGDPDEKHAGPSALLATPAPKHARTPSNKQLDTITEASPDDSPLQKKSRAITDIGAPDRGVKSARRTESPKLFSERLKSPPPVTPTPLSRKTLPSSVDTTSRETPPKDSPWQQVHESIDRTMTLSPARRLPHSSPSFDPIKQHVADQRSPSMASQRSMSNISRLRSPDQDRPLSSASNRSTHSLRRVDRSASGDLRAASRLGMVGAQDANTTEPNLSGIALAAGATAAIAGIAAVSGYDPVRGEGKGRRASMVETFVSNRFKM